MRSTSFNLAAVICLLASCASNDASSLDDAGLDDARRGDASDSPSDAGAARCGDGTRQSGEACDDGNVLNGDGCSSTCMNELLDWRAVNTFVTPDARQGACAAYDSVRDKVVMFGGYTSTGTALAELWEFDGSEWTKRTIANGPSARGGCAMSFDASRNLIVMFGGDGDKEDTWEYNGTTWTNRVLATHPGNIFAGGAMAYDSTREKIMLFEGDTKLWEFDGTAWLQRPSIVNSTTDGEHALTYDSVRQKLVLLAFNETWEFDGTAWTEVEIAPAQIPTVSRAMVFYPERSTSIRVGITGQFTPVDSREYNGTTWVPLVTPNKAPRRYVTTLVYDSKRHRLVFFGGSTNTQTYGDTWWLGYGPP